MDNRQTGKSKTPSKNWELMRSGSRTSKRNFARRNKTAFGPRGQDETCLKIEDLS
jgi:hypothetical protein